MLHKLFCRAGLAALLYILLCLSSPAWLVEGEAAARIEGSSLADKATDQVESFRDGPSGRTTCVRPPPRGILLALTRWGSTQLTVFDFSKNTLVPLLSRAGGEFLFAAAGARVAYLVREGVNPAKNVIEIIDLREGKCQFITPARGFAILGFALAPGGRELAYAGMDLRLSNSTRLSWRAAIADLDRFSTSPLVVSAKDALPAEAIPVPISWSSRTGEIIVRNLAPFRGMAHRGIMAIKPDGSRLRMILPEPSYTALPRLSPNGGALAYFTTQAETLPENYLPTPGAPPGNVIAVIDLATGEQSIWNQGSGGAFGAFAWSADGSEIVVSRQQWLEGRFRDTGLLRVRKKGSLELLKLAPAPSAKVSAIGMCKDRPVFWVEEDGARATLRGARPGSAPAEYAAHAEGKIRLVGCVGE